MLQNLRMVPVLLTKGGVLVELEKALLLLWMLGLLKLAVVSMLKPSILP